jgi:thiol-disulfide isomerase/thioredoxin
MRVGFLLVCALLVAGCSKDEPVTFADGSQTLMSHWDGRWLVINYWAEWCAPCRHEIPELNELHAGRVEHGLVVLGVNYDGLVQPKLGEVIERMEIKFPILAQDPQLRWGYERAVHLPITVLINPQREVHEILVGPQTKTSIMAAML